MLLQSLEGATNTGAIVQINPTGGVTLSAADMFTQFIEFIMATAAATATTDTAANIVSVYAGAQVNDKFPLRFCNSTTTVITLAGAAAVGGTTGAVTIVGTATIAAGAGATFMVVLTNVTAGTQTVSLYLA